MTYIKKIMEIGSGEHSVATEDVFDITGHFDMDEICGTLSFSLPYYIPYPDSAELQTGGSPEQLDLKSIKKFDTVKLYFQEFDEDPGAIEPTDTGYSAGGEPLKLIFDGFVDSIKLSISKSNISYNFEALGTLGLANYRNLEYQHLTGTAYELLPTWLQLAGLQQGQYNVYPVSRDLIPIDRVRFIDTDAGNWVWISEGGTTLKEVITDIRQKYAVVIHQSGDGFVNVITPVYLLQAPEDSTLSVNAWNFSIDEGNVFEIDYGELTNYYNAVVVIGQGGVHGVAVDPIAVANNDGQVNYLIHENRNLLGEEECQRVARNKLLDLEKNYFVTFKTKFHPDFMVMQPFTLNDNNKFTGNEVLLIKSYDFTISKTDISCTITGFSHAATLLPTDVALSDTGVLDVDVLQIRDKELNPSDWKNLGGGS